MIEKILKRVNIEDVIPYELNPRIHNEESVKAIVKSMKECEDLESIEVDENMVILAGHGRRLAHIERRDLEVDVIQYIGLTEEQKTKYRILSNKTQEYSDWDMEKLEQELEGFDFDLGESLLDEYGTEFSLPDGDKSEIVSVTFTLHQKQKELIDYAISLVSDNIKDTFGNTNKNGNGLYEVVRRWAEQKR